MSNHKKVHVICGMCGSADCMRLIIYEKENSDDTGYHFYCDNCNTLSADGEIESLIVTDKRAVFDEN